MTTSCQCLNLYPFSKQDGVSPGRPPDRQQVCMQAAVAPLNCAAAVEVKGRREGEKEHLMIVSAFTALADSLPARPALWCVHGPCFTDLQWELERREIRLTRRRKK